MAVSPFSFDWLFLIIAAPFVGSFLAVVAARIPYGKLNLFGRSACPTCGHRLATIDLVPILSWMLQRRCRYCAAPISLFYPLMEIGALLVTVSAALVFSGWLLWLSCVLGWTLLTIAAVDLRCMLIPDRLALPLIPAGLAVAYYEDPDSMAAYALGAGMGFLAFVVIGWLYRQIRGRDGLGLGDAKLLAASGAWVSISGLPSVVFLSAAIALLTVSTSVLMDRRISSADKVPFGAYLCLGTWLVWLFGPLLFPWIAVDVTSLRV